MNTISDFHHLSRLADINLDTYCISTNLEKTEKYSKSLRRFINIITFGFYGAYLKNQMIAVAKKIADVISHKRELISSGIKEDELSKVEELSKKIARKLKNSRHCKAYHILSAVLSQGKAAPENPPLPIKAKDLEKVPEEPSKKGVFNIQKVHPYPGDLPANVDTGTTFLDQGTIQFHSYSANFEFTVRNEKIFDSNAQVIVNAVNTHLEGGKGIFSIYRLGGEPIAKAHEELKSKYRGNYVRGYAEMITSGNLKDHYGIENVIVVAGPNDPSKAQSENELYSCYYNSLELADLNNKTSIAFPSISTGYFGFPIERSAPISFRAINDFIMTHPRSKLKKISIHFLDTDSVFKYYHNVDPF